MRLKYTFHSWSSAANVCHIFSTRNWKSSKNRIAAGQTAHQLKFRWNEEEQICRHASSSFIHLFAVIFSELRLNFKCRIFDWILLPSNIPHQTKQSISFLFQFFHQFHFIFANIPSNTSSDFDPVVCLTKYMQFFFTWSRKFKIQIA